MCLFVCKIVVLLVYSTSIIPPCITQLTLTKNLFYPDHEGWNILNDFDCGQSAADRIIGGTNAAFGQFPWLARLGYTSKQEEEEMQWLCAGALITNRHVLTAAHCLSSEDAKLTTVRLGEYDVRTNPDCALKVCAPNVQDKTISKIIKHPKFKNTHYDIAILVLKSPVQLHEHVSPICLPQEDQATDLLVGELLTVAGWGIMNLTTGNVPTILQVVQIPVVKRDLCDSMSRGFSMIDSELCVGTQLNKDTCNGDSGGPLMKVYDTVEGPKTYAIGVVSFGPLLCGNKKPAVYTSVPHFMKWILDTLLANK